jgi:hypothetical protein
VNNLLYIPVLIRDGGHLVMIGFGAYAGINWPSAW